MKIWTEEELINDGYRLRNAEITNVSLNMKDHGVLTLDLSLPETVGALFMADIV